MASLSSTPSCSSSGNLRFEWSSEVGRNQMRKAFAQSPANLPSGLMELVLDYSKEPAFIFTETDWKAQYGEVLPAPTLPANIESILQEDCPFVSGQKIRNTHMLVYIPTSLRGEPFNLTTVRQLSNASSPCWPMIAHFFSSSLQELDMPVTNAYWVLMPLEVFPQNRDLPYSDQKKMVAELAKKTPPDAQFCAYEAPKVFDVAICSLIKRVSFSLPFSNAYTICRESLEDNQFCVAYFDKIGLVIQPLKSQIGSNIYLTAIRKSSNLSNMSIFDRLWRWLA